MTKYIFLMLVILLIPTTYIIMYGRSSTHKAPVLQLTNENQPNHNTSARPLGVRDLYGKVELTVRMSLTDELIERFLCSLLRSTSVFWNPNYGNILLILDEEDRLKQDFQKRLSELKLPFHFRYVYEDQPKKKESFERLAREQERPYGYIRQLYSSFLMDMYTEAEVIAWIDTDVVFTMPVTNESIVRDGRLVVKGFNNFDRGNKFGWVKLWWDHTTRIAIGRPMVADFMSFFPIYIYPSTIRNCRNYIMKRFGVPTFEHAFFRFAEYQVSSVNIIMSYAYYFERGRYEWHIDTGPLTVKQYNKKRLPKQPPLLQGDVLPEPHVTVHARYFPSKTDPLEEAICHAQMNVGMSNIPHCNVFFGKPNLMLFEFQRKPPINHLSTWCHGNGLVACLLLIDERYKRFRELFEKGLLAVATDGINVVNEMAYQQYGIKCPKISYVPFKRKWT